MMDAKVIGKDRIVRLLDELIERYEVIAPVRSDDAVVFDQITSGSEALLGVTSSKLSPKGVFFPRSEVIFLYDGTQVEGLPPGRERVLKDMAGWLQEHVP